MSLKIVLLGYMGSGKSTIGKLLAERVNYNFIDLDDEIEKLENKKVSQIFDENGVIYFRKLENEVLKALLKSEKNIILSLGGGTPCYFEAMQYLNSRADVHTVYLDVSIPELVRRLFPKKSTRPLIENIITQKELTEFVGKHLFERRQFYRKAKTIISVNELLPKQVVDKIESSLF